MVRNRSTGSLVLSALTLLCAACSRPDSIAGYVDGIWETEWEDYVGEDDVDDIRITETLFLEPEETSAEQGRFGQVFTGEVDFDDFEYEQTINFQVVVTGAWKIADNNNIEMSYDLESMETSTGRSNVEADYTDAVVDLFTGNFMSALVGSAMSSNEQTRANERINKAVEKQVEAFFRNYLRELKHNKTVMKDIEIDGDVLRCEINTGWFGRDAVYDRKTPPAKKEVVDVPSSQTPDSTPAEEGDGPCASEDELLEATCFRGKLDDKYDIEFFYDTQTPVPTNSLQALYHYGTGNNGNLELWGSIDADGNMHLEEYNDSGKQTGTWNVVLSQVGGGWKISGSMTNYKGKTFAVDLRTR